MNKDDKELIDLKFKGVYQHQQANFDIVNVKLTQILNQVTLTNSRVDRLEKQTKFVRFFENNPKFAILTLLGIVFLLMYFDAKDLIGLLKP